MTGSPESELQEQLRRLFNEPVEKLPEPPPAPPLLPEGQAQEPTPDQPAGVPEGVTVTEVADEDLPGRRHQTAGAEPSTEQDTRLLEEIVQHLQELPRNIWDEFTARFGD